VGALADLDVKGVWRTLIVTAPAPLEAFSPAESPLSGHYDQNPRQRYCQIVIAPKVAKFRKEHLARLKR
jgi:peptide-methionine (S)-S-oxide reductase